jgi:structural maintenance of chromosome 1
MDAQNDEIERLAAERFSLYRRCKLEDIDLPLEKGSLDDIPIEEVCPLLRFPPSNPC